MSGLDVCYILLCMIAPHCIWLAKIPATSGSSHSPPTFSFPTGNEINHLLSHGFPPTPENDGASAVLCFSNGPAELIKTTKDSSRESPPLNINLTGALIDNGIVMLSERRSHDCHIAPHYIKNESGLVIRRREDIGDSSGDLCESEKLASGCEAPLSLKRGFPHRAYISLELCKHDFKGGSISDEYDSFHYKALGRIPVDLVGIKRYALIAPG